MFIVPVANKNKTGLKGPKIMAKGHKKIIFIENHLGRMASEK